MSDKKLSDKFVEWNELIVEELLTKAYVSLVQSLIEKSQKTKTSISEALVKMVYDCFPQSLESDPLWSKLIERFYTEIIKLQVFFSELRKGRWVQEQHAILNADDKYFLNIDKSNSINVKQTLKQVMLLLNMAYFDSSSNRNLLLKYANIQKITPLHIVECLKKSSDATQVLTVNEKLNILQFITQDQAIDFSGLILLPLCNKKFVAFTNQPKEVFVSYPDVVRLFPGLEDKFVDPELPKYLHRQFHQMASEERFQLRIIKINRYPGLLLEVFNKYCIFNEESVCIPKINDSPLNVEWIHNVWKAIEKSPNQLESFEHLPLIPQLYQDGCNVKCFHVLRGSYILSSYEDLHMRKLPDEVLGILQSHGVKVLTLNKVIKSTSQTLIGNYIKYPLYESIIELCENKPEMKREIQTHIGLSKNIWMAKKTSAKSFGQREDLVNKLKRILSGYPEDHSILKELLQNADDAGASKIHFLYDMRDHERNRIFNEAWIPLQGPALNVFNDACFTDKDLEGIQKLGIGSKAEERTKTGQFGIGFNSVYHLTDAPMIMSLGDTAAWGGFFCVLDPQCRYAPLATDGDPGMVIEIEEVKYEFPGVFDTFLSSNELESTKGTWFRFPLRLIPNSKISEVTYTSEVMTEMLKKMARESHECLLFLLNIRQITISVVNVLGIHKILTDVKIYNVDAKCNQQSEFKKCFQTLDHPSKLFSICEPSIKEFKYLVDITELTGQTIRWLIVQTLGFCQPQNVDQSLKMSLERMDFKFLPRGGVAMKLSDQMINEAQVPAKAFCLLPLPIETGLTCHVNGQFSVDMSRNALWGSDEQFPNDIRGVWNYELIRQNISFAYAGCIDYIIKLNDKNALVNMRTCIKYFPAYDTARSTFWRALVYYLFLHLRQRQLRVFPYSSVLSELPTQLSNTNEPNPEKWLCRHNKNEAELMADNLTICFKSDESANPLRTLLLRQGMKLVNLPEKLQCTILNACTYYHKYLQTDSTTDDLLDNVHNPDTCICISNISPESVIMFFKSGYDSGNFKTVSEVRICLEYCLKGKQIELLDGVHLLLRNDHTFIEFKKHNDLILTEFSDLLPKSKERFVHEILVDLFCQYSRKFKALTAMEFLMLLPKSINASEFRNKVVRLDESDCTVSKKWVERFWKFVDSTSGSIDVLKDWSFLPVSIQSSKYLIPLEYCKYTIDYSSFENNQKLCKIFKKIAVSKMLVRSTSLSALVATHEKRDAILDSLHFWNMNKRNIFSDLTTDDFVTLAEYLVDKIDDKQQELIKKLKQLKIFISLEGSIVDLTANNFVTIRDTSLEFPLDGLDTICQICTLNFYPALWKLYKLIKCNEISVSKLYTTYILNKFHHFDLLSQMNHLEYIKHALIEDKAVIASLKSMAFIRVGQTFKRACDFYNPGNPLFKKVCADSEFPPPPFADEHWRKLLLYAGMITTVSDKDVLKFAIRISQGHDKEAINQSCALLKALFDLMENPQTDSFYNEISQIKFIPNQSSDAKFKFLSFAGSLSSDCWTIAWSSADVLPSFAMPNSTEKAKRLKIILEPCFAVVEQHTVNICEIFEDSCEKYEKSNIEKIMTDIYTYLTKNIDRASSLCDVPLVYVSAHDIFTRTRRIVKNMSIEDEITPFLVKAPDMYGAFFELFQCLGMHDKPSINAYSQVLTEIYNITGNRVLTAVELDNVHNALRCLVKCLQRLYTPLNDLSEKILYLLSEDNCLMPSTDLYYATLEIPKDRIIAIIKTKINFLSDFKYCGLNTAQLEELFSFLPEKYRPISLRSIFTEKVNTFEPVESETATKLYDCLTSEEFILAILRCIKSEQIISKMELKSSDIHSIFAKLRRLRVVAVHHLTTELMQGHTTLKSTSRDKNCFYDDSTEILFINDCRLDFEKWMQAHDVELARSIRTICQGKVKVVVLLNFLSIMSTNLNVISERLTQLEMPYLEDKLITNIWYPLPGSLVPERLVPLLRKPVDKLGIKEYAVISLCLNDESRYKKDCNSEDAVHVPETFIYAIITDFVSKGGIYKLNIGRQTEIDISEKNILLCPQYPEQSFVEPYHQYHDDTEDIDNDILENALDNVSTAADEAKSNKMTGHAHYEPNPQPNYGRIWLKQAEYDLLVGSATLEGIDRKPFKGYNWVCLQAQQAAEKAIKAANFAIDAHKVQRTHILCVNVPESDLHLMGLASNLQMLAGDINRLRYPGYTWIPADLYSRETGTKALDFAQKIISHVSTKYYS